MTIIIYGNNAAAAGITMEESGCGESEEMWYNPWAVESSVSYGFAGPTLLTFGVL